VFSLSPPPSSPYCLRLYNSSNSIKTESLFFLSVDIVDPPPKQYFECFLFAYECADGRANLPSLVLIYTLYGLACTLFQPCTLMQRGTFHRLLHDSVIRVKVALLNSGILSPSLLDKSSSMKFQMFPSTTSSSFLVLPLYFIVFRLLSDLLVNWFPILPYVIFFP